MLFEIERIGEIAARHGFDRVAAVRASDAPPVFERWIADARERFPHLKLTTDPRDEMPSAETVLLCSRTFPYYDEFPADCGRVGGYYLTANRAYQDANKMMEELRENGADAKFCNLPLKPLARACGFGEYAQNTMITSNDSMRLFQAVVLDAKVSTYTELLSDSGIEKSGLIQAERNCVSNALHDGKIDVGLCIRNHMLRGTVVPEPLRRLMGLRLLGCDICQRRPGMVAEAVPEDYAELFALEILLDEVALYDLKDRFADVIGANYARPRLILCQAALIAGNAPNAEKYLPQLHKLKDHGDAAIREHALWAIKSIGCRNDGFFGVRG